MTHQEFLYGDGTASGSRATEVFTSLQSGHVGQVRTLLRREVTWSAEGLLMDLVFWDHGFLGFLI